MGHDDYTHQHQADGSPQHVQATTDGQHDIDLKVTRRDLLGEFFGEIGGSGLIKQLNDQQSTPSIVVSVLWTLAAQARPLAAGLLHLPEVPDRLTLVAMTGFGQSSVYKAIKTLKRMGYAGDAKSRGLVLASSPEVLRRYQSDPQQTLYHGVIDMTDPDPDSAGARAPGRNEAADSAGARAPGRNEASDSAGARAPGRNEAADSAGARAPGRKTPPSQVPPSIASKDSLSQAGSQTDCLTRAELRQAIRQSVGSTATDAWLDELISEAPPGLDDEAIAWSVRHAEARARRLGIKASNRNARIGLTLEIIRQGDWQAGLAEARERRLRAEDARRRSEAAQRQREADARESSQSWADIDATIDTADADALAEAHRRAIEQAPTPHAAKAWKQADPRAADAPRGLRTLIVHHLTATGAEAPGHTEAAPQGLGGRSTTDAPSAGQEAPPAVCADRPPRDAGAGKTS